MTRKQKLLEHLRDHHRDDIAMLATWPPISSYTLDELERLHAGWHEAGR